MDTKFVKKLQEKWKGSGIDMTTILWHKICEKKLQEKWKGSGIDMTTILWHKICEKSYKKNEKVAE